VDPATGFKYQLELDSMGAAIRTALFSEFEDRDRKDPKPQLFLSPVDLNGREVLPLASAELTILDEKQKLNLSRLSWKALGVRQQQEGGSSAAFEATIIDANNLPVLKLTKTYQVDPNTYLAKISLQIQNLAQNERRIQYALTGATGLEKEIYGTDMRKIIAGFRTPQGEVASVGLDVKALTKAQTPEARALVPRSADWGFLWIAAVNKYFAAILIPQPDEGKQSVDWLTGRWGMLYHPDQDRRGVSGNETIGFVVSSAPVALSPAGQDSSSRTYDFQLYLGPKDKGRFDKVELYRQLGFVHTIDFMPCCCCPATIINPIAFAILAIMKWMYVVIPNYGIVIIILVLLMRLALHPITKHSQVSMHKMSKLAPRAEEIKKKYGDNKAEMNKKLMELYREQGASPIMSMLPMFVQMPVWIALWSAIYTSIDLRGAPFLPVWITDLSVPDALVPFPAIVTIPLVGWLVYSLNLLPILMGVAFYLQQKLMPMQQAAAATNPQLAQQQKMMNIMMPLMFPLMLYNAPSGVNLYIMASTFAGVIEQYVIKKHIAKKEQHETQGLISATSKTGGKVKKKRPKPFYRFR
jgi:YidC/Oxa1 family membrane protein insertase